MSERSLRLLTWNLNGLETTRLDARMEAACIELVLGTSLARAAAGAVGPPMPEVICLQEVVARAQLGHLRAHLGAAGFTLYPDAPRRDEGDYGVIAVRPPWRIVAAATVPFSHSPLGREWLEVEVEGRGGGARVITAHMESLRSGAAARLDQARELTSALAREGAPAVFAGDTNLREAEARALAESGDGPIDAWERGGSPAAHRDTWWPQESERGFRFDRIWLPAGSPMRVAELRTRRRPAISDHAALEARVEW